MKLLIIIDWLIHLQITACKYRSAANNWCKYFIEHRHFENASSASIKKYLSCKMSTLLVLPSYQKANCPLYYKKRMQKTPKKQLKLHISQGAFHFHVYSTSKLRRGTTCPRRTSFIKQINCQICRQ